MRPKDKVEDAVHNADCEAPDAMRRRMWNDVADTLRQAHTPGRADSVSYIRTLLTNRRIPRLAVAALVVAGALAIGVESWRPSKPSKAYAFSAQIRANTALDLDPKAAIPLMQPQPEDFDVTWDGENGGTLRIVAGPSLRILGCRYIDPEWDSVVSWAYANLDELRNSTAIAVTPTPRTPFAAVLTSEGNLAIIRIGGHDEAQAWLCWRVETTTLPGYSPVQIITLHGVDQESAALQPCAIDFDSGQTVGIPPQVLRMPAEGLIAWLEQNGIDAVARMSEEGDGLVGVGLVFWTWMPSGWADTDPVELREEMTRASYQPRRPLLFHGDRYQYVFPFKTREGAIGMLQMLAADKSKRTVQFRYRTVREEDADTETEDDVESQRLAESVQHLMRFGLMAWKYAEEHDWQYPATVDELKDYAKMFDQDFRWILDNVGYVGAGKIGQDPPDTLIAYDRTLLAKGKGTNGVFRDGHAEFLPPDVLAKYGLSDKPQNTPPMSPR